MTNSSDLLLLQQIKNELSPSQLQQFMLVYPGRKKSVGAGILLALFLGGFGAHWFYLGNPTKAVIYLICSIVGLALAGIPTIIIAVLCIVDACRMGNLVAQANNFAAMNLKEELKLIES